MNTKSKLCVGLFLSASITASVLADGTWEVVALNDGISPANINGIAGAVWVPNSLNNPVIDQNGKITFRAQIAGPNITNLGGTANHVVIVSGFANNWSVPDRTRALPAPTAHPTWVSLRVASTE